MQSAPSHDAVESFNPLRPSLTRVAYRMLGSVADAEDVVQDAFLRWLNVERDGVREPIAFLRRVVTRLCLDRLKLRIRENYVGSWLPEPVVEPIEHESDDVTLPLLMALERLSPLERAAFLLHDVFGLGFEEIAKTIRREPTACRRLASRARNHVRADHTRYPISKERGFEIAAAFFAASREGDMERLRSLLAVHVTLYADGGGRAPARKTPAIGVGEVIRMFKTFTGVYAVHPSRFVRFGLVNGLPGFISIENEGILQTTALETEANGITAIYVVRNPDKVRHLM